MYCLSWNSDWSFYMKQAYISGIISAKLCLIVSYIWSYFSMKPHFESFQFAQLNRSKAVSTANFRLWNSAVLAMFCLPVSHPSGFSPQWDFHDSFKCSSSHLLSQIRFGWDLNTHTSTVTETGWLYFKLLYLKQQSCECNISIVWIYKTLCKWQKCKLSLTRKHVI